LTESRFGIFKKAKKLPRKRKLKRNRFQNFKGIDKLASFSN
jgi:hypothetical protein